MSSRWRGGGDPIDVTVVEQRVPAVDSLAAYLALVERFGRDQVYLLESDSGPEADRRYHFTGFGVLLRISVTSGAVRVEGVPALRRVIYRRMSPFLDPFGQPRLQSLRALWPALREIQAAFRTEGSASRFRFGFLCYFGYDVARYIEDLPYLIRPEPGLPDLQLVLYRGCLVSDVATGTTELLLHQSPVWPAIDQDDVIALLVEAGRRGPPPPGRAVPGPDRIRDDTSYEEFLTSVLRCLDFIAAGEIYQVLIGHEVTVRSLADPLDVYLRLRARNPSPFMYLTTIQDHTIIGASPELFMRLEDGTVTMRPIAGTVPRRPGDDEAAAAWLRSDVKELAEHTMLVDLCRNDIGRICVQDTLDVPEMLRIQTYSHVLHLVSTVTGRADAGPFDVIAALFPAGTMTGAPKIRAMEIIEEIERSRRGLYAGAIGLIDVGGYANLALCIRTLIHRHGDYRIRASAGIVADSDPAREWRETMAKANACYWAVTGREL